MNTKGKLSYESALQRAAMIKIRDLIRRIEASNGTLTARELRLVIERDGVLGSVLANSPREPIVIGAPSE